MIKVRVGQWFKPINKMAFFTEGSEYKIRKELNNGFIIEDDDPTCPHEVNDEWINENFEFIPQNDLEVLAIKMDKWPATASEALIILRGSGFYWRGDFIFKQGCKSIFKQQWQNMRYHLGQDKKPHYRLTSGEWVKV